MSDFYKLVAIEGKGFGCVATKKIKPGTLIFSEKPAVTALGNCPETIYLLQNYDVILQKTHSK